MLQISKEQCLKANHNNQQFKGNSLIVVRISKEQCMQSLIIKENLNFRASKEFCVNGIQLIEF